MNAGNAVKWARVLGENDVDIIARAIQYDIADRRGFRSVMEDCDNEVIEEMRETWRNIINEVLNVD